MPHISKMIEDGSICEMFGLYGATGAESIILKDVAEKTQDRKTKIIMFSDNMANHNGEAIANFIKKHKLGLLQETKPERSLNTGATINTWIWTIDHDALQNLFKPK